MALLPRDGKTFRQMYLVTRALWRLMLTIAHIALGHVFGIFVFPWLVLDQRRQINQWWSVRLLGFMGIQIESRHTRKLSESGHGLIVSNHVSFIDIVLINALVPSTFVSKDDVAGWPIIGSLAKHAGTIFIERGNRRAAQLTRALMTTQLRSGQRLAIFPEGTSTSGSHVLPFHAALFQAAVDTNTPVFCLAISYFNPAGLHCDRPAFTGDMSFFECLWRTLSSECIRAHIHHVQTLKAPHSNRQHLAHYSRFLITHSRDELARNQLWMKRDPQNELIFDLHETVRSPSEADFLNGTIAQ